MLRKKMKEQEKRRKELIKELLRDSPLKDGQDLNNIMKEFIVEIVNGILEGRGYIKDIIVFTHLVEQGYLYIVF